jgi:hypothetical protein
MVRSLLPLDCNYGVTSRREVNVREELGAELRRVPDMEARKDC